MKNTTKNITLFFLAIMLSTGWFGCLKDISKEVPKHEPKITVNSFLTPQESIKAYITKSRGAIESSWENYLMDAEVYIYEDEQLVDSLLSVFESHLSASNFVPQIGKQYRIEVSNPGFESVSAITDIPTYVPIQSISLDTTFYSPTGHNTYVLRIKFTDPPSAGDYYHLLITRLRLNPMGDWNSEFLCYVTDDAVFESLSKEQCTGGTFSDALFNGLEKELAINTKRRLNQKLNDSVQFVVELRHGSKPYFDYNNSLILFKNGQWDIFSQPASVQGNIKNGYGIFAGYAAVVDTVKLN